ncbi:MAG: ribosome assembly factor SBDS [archaeon]
MQPIKNFSQEQVKISLARLKKGGEHFEVIIEPDKVIDYKNKKISDVKEILRYEKIFSDARKGLAASDVAMKALFGTNDPHKVAEVILKDGEIQFTQEYRDSLRIEKRNRILDIICRNAIDPKTHLPHPRTRIEGAFEEAKIRIDEMKDAESQINDIIVKLRPILPIKFAVKEIRVKIGPSYAPKAYPVVSKFGKIKIDNWMSDGSWLCTVEIPAGIQNDFFDALNKLTKGEAETTIVSEK